MAHVGIGADGELEAPAWTHGASAFAPEEFGLAADEADAVPDISVDQEELLLTAINTSSDRWRHYVLTLGHRLLDSSGAPLAMGVTRREDGSEQACVTLVLVLPPMTLLDVAVVEPPAGAAAGDVPGWLELQSDVGDLQTHADPHTLDPARVYAFPLPADRGPYLCSQGMGGQFTHFMAPTFHAVDLEADVGVPVLAVAAGRVTEVRQQHRNGGIHVDNLFRWNSVTMELADGVVVDYVHIRPGSVCVEVGQHVAEGQQLCEVGDVGFCPRPHLHLQMHASDRKDAPTIKFALRSGTRVFVPEAGKRYS